MMASYDWLDNLRVKRGDLNAFSEPLRSSLVRVYENEFGRKIPDELSFSQYWKKLEVTAFYDSKECALAETIKKGSREFGITISDKRIDTFYFLDKMGIVKSDLHTFPIGTRIWLEEVIKDHFPRHWEQNKEIPLNRIYHLLNELKVERSREYHRSFDTLLETDPHEMGRAISNHRQEQGDWAWLKTFGAIAASAFIWIATAEYRATPDPDYHLKEKQFAQERVEREKRTKELDRKIQASIASQILGKLEYERRTEIVKESDNILRRANVIEYTFSNITAETIADIKKCKDISEAVFRQHDAIGQSLDCIFELTRYRRIVNEKNANGIEYAYLDIHLPTKPEKIDELVKKLHESNPESIPSVKLFGQSYLSIARKQYLKTRKTLLLESPSKSDLELLAHTLLQSKDEHEKFTKALTLLKNRSTNLAAK